MSIEYIRKLIEDDRKQALDNRRVLENHPHAGEQTATDMAIELERRLENNASAARLLGLMVNILAALADEEIRERKDDDEK